MFPLFSLVALLSLAAPPPTADIGPFVGDDVALVVHLNLARWEIPGSSRRLLGKLADEADLASIAAGVDGWIAALRKTGATDLYLLIDPSDMPGFPVAVIPLPRGVDARDVTGLITGGGSGLPARWPKAETIREAVVAGTPDALTRVLELKAGRRPELVDALASAGNAPLRIAVIPTKPQRRAIEESFPTLPSEVGGGPIESVTRGLSWASIGVSTGPGASLQMVARAKDAESARVFQKVAQEALGLLAGPGRFDRAMAQLTGSLARVKAEVDGETVRLEADLDKATAVVAVPILRARESSRVSECVNNLKQIGLAMHNYHATHNSFPAAFTSGKDGKPLLSWRVQILPFLEQKELYEQFHLDESWDSPHNKPLSTRMPRVYACPGGSQILASEGKTTYLTPRGPGTTFPGAVGIKIKDITDGISNTILVVDAGDPLAVTWTKPDDWDMAPDFKIQGLFGHHSNSTPFGFADGSVRTLKKTISPKLLQAMTTRNAGEVLGGLDE